MTSSVAAATMALSSDVGSVYQYTAKSQGAEQCQAVRHFTQPALEWTSSSDAAVSVAYGAAVSDSAGSDRRCTRPPLAAVPAVRQAGSLAHLHSGSRADLCLHVARRHPSPKLASLLPHSVTAASATCTSS